MEIRKIGWAIRGIVYKLFLGTFGNMSYIGKPIYLLGKKSIFIGDRVRIYPGARMETHNDGKIVIGNNTSIAQNFHITAGEEKLYIGENTTIAGNVFVTNIDHEYRGIDEHILDQKCHVKKTQIGKGCFIGFGAAIQAGTILGKQCIVGTNAVVRGHFPDYSVIVGVPAKVIKTYNSKTKEWERVSNSSCNDKGKIESDMER